MTGIPKHAATTYAEATKVASRINRYWAERGFDAGAYVFKDLEPLGKSTPGYCVRTALVNGIPTRRLRQNAA